jgi:hypothetical protein
MVYFVRVAIPIKVPLEDGRTEVDLVWQKYDEAREVLRKSLEWAKEKLA